MTITEDEIDRRLLAEQKQWNDEQELLKKVGTSGGNGHDKEESETPIADEEVQHYLGDNEDEEDEEDEGSPAKRLLGLVDNANILLFKDQYKIPNASITFGGHTEILRIESNAFKRYLVKQYYDSTHGIIGSESVKSVVQILQARAEYEGETYPLVLRVAWHNDHIIYDLTNDKWQCINISKEGWTFEDKTPRPLFMRYSQTSQTNPNRDYPGDIFDQFLGLTNLKNEDDRLLLKVYIATLFIPDLPHVMLVLHGEKGSAKSTLQTLIKMLVDPAKPSLLTIYNDVKEFIQQLAHNHVAYYDNLKHTPRWLSDEACQR